MVMKSTKSKDGLTHGRGMTKRVISKWILSVPANKMFSRTYCISSDQHIEMGGSRMRRNNEDVITIFEYLCLHSQFPETKRLISITTVLVGD
ncbi:hypothetical protein PR048_011052 [Dryococelus australis]|uniref:Uncharacterized protein n=1 Tax=Dryococelus australis TaxID=614101 RepID=A0ABQ9HL74_9NEOP|nr:hypothetical protein PR048_011052 [Dryococelus australis]